MAGHKCYKCGHPATHPVSARDGTTGYACSKAHHDELATRRSYGGTKGVTPVKLPPRPARQCDECGKAPANIAVDIRDDDVGMAATAYVCSTACRTKLTGEEKPSKRQRRAARVALAWTAKDGLDTATRGGDYYQVKRVDATAEVPTHYVASVKGHPIGKGWSRTEMKDRCQQHAKDAARGGA